VSLLLNAFCPRALLKRPALAAMDLSSAVRSVLSRLVHLRLIISVNPQISLLSPECKARIAYERGDT
jgi:hypothetical protein